MKNVKIDKDLNRVLGKDPLHDMERFTGKHWSQFDEEENKMSLFHAMITNQATNSYLKSLGDTNFSTTWNEFINIIEGYGFIEGLRYDFKHGNDTDEAILYYHPEKGLVIWATSYWNKKSVNGGTMYGQIKLDNVNATFETNEWGRGYKNLDIDDEKYKEINNALFKCSHGALCDLDTGVTFSYDIREGLINKIEHINSVVELMPVWNQKQFLWFLDFTEDDEKDYDYKKITKEKFNKCPRELQDIIKVCF